MPDAASEIGILIGAVVGRFGAGNRIVIAVAVAVAMNMKICQGIVFGCSGNGIAAAAARISAEAKAST